MKRKLRWQNKGARHSFLRLVDFAAHVAIGVHDVLATVVVAGQWLFREFAHRWQAKRWVEMQLAMRAM